jgi:anti-anti-sigma factor
MAELAALDVERRDHIVIISIAGEIDVSNAEVLTDQITDFLGSAPRPVIDFASVTYFDSSGVRMLVTLANKMAERGDVLHLIVPADSPTERVLSIVGVSTFANVHADVEDALFYLRRDEAPYGRRLDT